MAAPFLIQSLDPAAHLQGVLKLLRACASFDGGIGVLSADELAGLLDHALTEHGGAWRVAISQHSVVGLLDVRFVGTKRTELRVAVNPAFRRQGMATALFAEAPLGRRLLTTTRASVPAATALLTKLGFSERFRDVRLRRDAHRFDAIEMPSWASLDEDRTRDPRRYLAMLTALGDDVIDDSALAAATLARAGCRAFYVRSPKGDDGLALIVASTQAKKAEQRTDGSSFIGVLERADLTKAVRGKGLSRPLVRAGLNALVDDGYTVVEAYAPKQRQAAIDLFLKEGFEIVDEDIHWIRRDDGS
jgi:ribosomal protein S18 acetylase RimI-like enzyme